MRKTVSFSLILLLLVLSLALLLPTQLAQSTRNFLAARLSPLWLFIHTASPTRERELLHEIKRLELENSQLRQMTSPSASYTALSAQVIVRSHAAWQSFLWLNIGAQGAPFPLKNAPVLDGDTLVGVIEEVGAKESRVRLISDPRLNPSVRIVRDKQYLAKGELNGAIKPLFQYPGTLLKGTGFNYDFPDEEGPAQDLRAPIIQKGDLLVTTGFDGVFPKGLKVARITRVLPLKEGDYYYDIEAESLSGNLNNLERLYILPPIR